MNKILKYFGKTIANKNGKNEDHYFINVDHNIYGVSDGMSGWNGAEASKIVAEELVSGLENVIKETKDADDTVFRQKLADEIQRVNNVLFNTETEEKWTHNGVEKNKIGATLDLIIVREDIVYPIGVGDSLAYGLTTNNELKKLTSVEKKLNAKYEDEVHITPEEEMFFLNHYMPSRWLGKEEKIEIKIDSYIIENFKRFLLTTDTMAALLTDEEIRKVFIEGKDEKDTAYKLTDLIENPNEMVKLHLKFNKKLVVNISNNMKKEYYTTNQHIKEMVDESDRRRETIGVNFDVVQEFCEKYADIKNMYLDMVKKEITCKDEVTFIVVDVIETPKEIVAVQPQIKEEPEKPSNIEQKVIQEQKQKLIAESNNWSEAQISILNQLVKQVGETVGVDDKIPEEKIVPVIKTTQEYKVYKDDITEADKSALSLHYLLNEFEEGNNRTTTLYRENISRLKERLDNGRDYLKEIKEDTAENMALLERQAAKRLHSDLALIKEDYNALNFRENPADEASKADGFKKITGHLETVSAWKELNIAEYNDLLVHYETKLNALKNCYTAKTIKQRVGDMHDMG